MADRSASGRHGSRGHAGTSAALARLLHNDCTKLLDSYKKTESLPSSPVDGPLVSVPPLVPQLSEAEKISILHAALRECQRLLKDIINLEDDEFPDEDSDYKKKQKTVKDRLGHLLTSMEQLLVDGHRIEAKVTEELDGQVSSGSFRLKMWIVHVLQDLVYWTGQTSKTLRSLPAEKEKAPKKISQSTRRGTKKERK